MAQFIQAAVIGVMTVIIASLLKKTSRELALLLSISACILISLILLQLAKPVVDFFSKLRELAQLDKALMTPMLKTIGIGLLTQLCATVCSDAGENAVANLIELCGGILALYVALPLLEAVIDMVQSMSGG